MDERADEFVVRIGPADLEPFVVEHYPRLIRLAVLLCRHGGDAEDAVQTALERAWRSRHHLQDPARIRPWLDRIVVREAARLLRNNQRVAELRSMTDERSTADAADTVAIKVALARLSSDQRAAVVLHLYAGYSVADTAAIVSAPAETVRSRLRVARDLLRHALREDLRP